jgi:hypothetical protein
LNKAVGDGEGMIISQAVIWLHNPENDISLHTITLVSTVWVAFCIMGIPETCLKNFVINFAHVVVFILP